MLIFCICSGYQRFHRENGSICFSQFEGESVHESEDSRLQIKQQLLVRKLLKTQ